MCFQFSKFSIIFYIFNISSIIEKVLASTDRTMQYRKAFLSMDLLNFEGRKKSVH